MLHVKTVAILEVMWGEPRDVAPGFFRINPHNFSGKRLYHILGHESLLVTNACRELVESARHKGTPDPERLAKNLQRLTYDQLLVCGKVAQRTFKECGYTPKCRVYMMPHPAARDWTKARIDRWRSRLCK